MNNTYNLSQSERVYLGRVGTTKTIALPSRPTEQSRPARRKTEKPKADLQKLMDSDVNFKKWIIGFTKAGIDSRIVIKFDKSDVIEYIYLSEPATMDKALELYQQLTAKRVDSNPKNAGRKRLDDAVREEREEKRKDVIVNHRKQLDESRREKKQAKRQHEAQVAEKHKQILTDRERLQSLQNKAASATATKEDLPEGCTIVEGMFAQRGKTAIRINAKTIIYVKNGHSILHAIEKHLLHQKLQLAI
ncbi:hypothetical protein J3L18_05480 [Mucilaginibacter gossypii]|uniref:hypothetical protein n=1 Tax=Mucilaginibacter gossypii TaxID=551996 RepID=UPI000DCF58F8|nr:MULTISPECIES: hypothetical protein [Mucilaginibacter]QTE38530.1 hypothetical protein J3L18_05480 [Mucilaginibacter gossypii]RAV55736.1 hypothetical protein DIU36_16730 [Mucilaginibacter rubeus]